jgi:hypothetical protein
MTEAEEVLADQLTRWRQESWMTLKEHLKDPVAYELEGESGTTYQFELVVFWDGPRGGDLRAIFTGDDGKDWRWRGMRTDDFIKAPDDSFVDE